ncbi:MAG: SUMF1/EgtB/PvdO family nonheme iron enzyme [Marinoscillum sp.]|uniref:formylglycine-generating enzyme family protein n=1 Tax=Marinoscillum sp. TaxID=2024838 RepID=UPI0032FCD7D7
MKTVGIIVMCLLVLPLFGAYRPEDIPSKVVEVKARNWYLEKYRSWRDYLGQNAQDKSGWVECFEAALYSGMPSDGLKEIADEVNKHFPNSSESHWVTARLLGYTDDGIVHLEKALADLDHHEWLVDRMMLSEIKGVNRAEYSRELFHSNVMYPSLLNYAYNVLMSVGENGILITEGETTTIPIWVLQDEMGVRTDVKILNLELIENNAYQERVFGEMGIKTRDGRIENLYEANPDQSFYYALTLPRQHFERLNDKLYVVGLASLFSETEINNYEVLRANIEDRFLLDYLTVDFNGEPKTATGRTFEANYIVPFYLLKQYYDQQGDDQKSKFLEAQIKSIADRSQIRGRVNMLLSQKPGPRTFKVIALDIKSLDKGLTKVKDNIYAGVHEVTNAEYQFFLTYLGNQKYDELLEIARYRFEDYDPINKAFSQSYHFNTKDDKVMNYADYPTMDISFEAAKLYCEWLTAQYNEQDGRAFKKVKFRLPSRQEWTMAALGYVDFQSWNFEDNVVRARPDGEGKPRYFEEYRIGDYDSVSYPWYHGDWFKLRNSIVNEKGCFLANIKAPENVTPCVSGREGDGYRLTSPVLSYFSNDMGLYDVIGNVAEMINEPGKAMGGSWNHPANESTITSINEYDERSNAVGFRIFMEVLEE